MNEIKKENDILVSALLNPNATINDLIQNGVTSENTGLMSPEEYKKSKFIQLQFTDEQGNFNDELFNKVYLKAAQNYDELASVRTYKNLEKYIQYSADDIYAPIGSLKITPTFSINKIRNPYGITKGVSSLFGEGQQTKSNRELAQSNKIWDNETQEWLEYSPEDLNIFRKLFGKSLVYATWDEDGEHFDEYLGRTVLHKKGEWKTDKDGRFYAETIGNKEAYGKQFVSASDILTREDSWINNIDFFDSDDLSKSVSGTIFKTAATIAPYLIPYFNVVWGGVTASVALASVLPTFAKMLGGVFGVDENSNFTKNANLVENYFSKYNDSFSDEAQGKIFSFEQVANMVGDVFGLLYLMNAMYSLSKLLTVSNVKAETKAIEAFQKNFGQRVLNAINNGEYTGDAATFYKKMVLLSPELKAITRSNQKLGKSLALGYMALTSSADVFSDALAGGYDRRTAGLAGLLAAAGQYGLMMNNAMGDWFLRASTGYTENINRGLMKKAILPYYSQIKEALAKVTPATSAVEKERMLAQLFKLPAKGFKGWINLIKDGSEDFWKRAIIEGTEEVTEEAVMDATKGIFDVFSWLGFTGQQGSFGGFDNVFSKEGLSRYLMSAVGGFTGGALFEFQGRILEPAITNKKLPPEIEANLVHEIMNGNTEALLKAADELAKSDSDIYSGTINIDGKEVSPSADNKTQTRGEAIATAIKTYVKALDSIINGNNLAHTDEEIFNKALITEKVKSALEKNKIIGLAKDSRITDLVLADFESLTESIVKTQLELELASKNNNEELIKNLNKTLNEQRKQVDAFLTGEFAEDYMKKALALSNPIIREGIENLDIYDFTKNKYGKSYKEFPVNGAGVTQESISKEYDEYIKSKGDVRKYLNIVLTSLDQIDLKFSPSFKVYSSSKYEDVRKQVLNSLLSNYNILNALLKGDFKEFVKRASESLIKLGLPGLTASDIFLIDPETLTLDLLGTSLDKHDNYFLKIAEITTSNEVPVSSEDIKTQFKAAVASELQAVPVNTITTEMVNAALLRANTLFGNILYLYYKKLDLDPNLILNELGFKSIDTSKETAVLEFIINTAPITTEDITVSIDSKLLSQYLDTLVDIDQEMINLYKKIIYPILKDDIQIVPRLASEISPDIEIADDSLRLFDSKIKSGLDLNKSTDEIVQDFLFNSNDGVIVNLRANDRYYQKAEQENPNISNKLFEHLINNLFKSPLVSVYNKAITKNIKANPLYDLLRQMQLEISSDSDTTIFDVLESENTYLQGLISPEDYIRLGVSMEKLKNALEIIKLAKAVVETMNTVSGETPYGYNALIKLYLEKNGKDSSAYELLDQSAANSITSDLELIENKLDFLIALSDSNTISKRSIDTITKKNFSSAVVNKLIEKAGILSVKGMSVISEDVLTLLSNQTVPVEERLELAEHLIYSHLLPILNKQNVSEIAHDLIASGNFNILNIFNSNLQSNGLGNPALSEYDLLVYLTTIIASDSNDFLYNYKQLLSNDDYLKTPLFTLEYSTKLAYSLENDKIGLHDAIIEELYKDNNPNIVKIKNIFFLNGISGVGKTSVCAQNIFKLIESKYTRIAVSAPNSILKDKLYNQLTNNVTNETKSKVTSYTKDDLFKLFILDDIYSKLKQEIADSSTENKTLIKLKFLDGKYIWILDTDNQKISKNINSNVLPEVIFIDEVTHFSSIELELLGKLTELYNIKIFSFGDTLQDGSPVADNIQHIDTVFRWQTPRLENSMRPSYVNKLQNINLLTARAKKAELAAQKYGIGTNLRNLLTEQAKEGTILKYYESDNLFTGDKLVEKITVEDIKRLKNSTRENPIGIITKLDSSGNPSGELSNLLKSAGLEESDYKLYSSLPIDENAVQGSEADYFIIDDFNFSNDLFGDLTRFYTFITRSLTGSIAKISALDADRLGIQNRLDSYTEMYKNPSAELNLQLKKIRIDQISTTIGNYVPSANTAINPITNNKVIEHDQSNKILNELLHKNPDVPTRGLDMPSIEKHNDFIKCYTFYNRLGIEYDKSGHFVARNDGSHSDLSDLFAENTEVSRDIVLGFIKVKNLITLYPDVLSIEFKLGLKDSLILNFFKSILKEQSSLLDGELIDWLINNLEISKTDSIIGKKYNPVIDNPVYVYDFSIQSTLNSNDVFLTIGRNIKTKNGEINLNITLASFPKLSSLLTWENPRLDFIEAIEKLEETVKSQLGNKPNVIIPINSRSTIVLRGRIVNAKNAKTFTSLSSMENHGIVIKELGLIAPLKNKGEYSFIKYLKDKYLIEQPWLVSDGELTVSGLYYAIVEFERSDNTKYKQLLILGTAERDFTEIIHDIKSINAPTRKNVGRYLSEYSQTKLVLSALNKINAYQNKPLLLKYFTDLRDYLASRTKQENYYNQINTLTNFINNFKDNPDTLTEESIKNMLLSSLMIGIYFVLKYLAEKDYNISMFDYISNTYKSVNFEGETGFYNIYPSGDIKENGTYSLELLSNDYLYLGLKGKFAEMPNIGLTPNELNNQTQILNNKQTFVLPELSTEEFSDLLIAKGYDSVEDLDDSEQKINQIILIVPKGQLSSYIDLNDYKVVNLLPTTEIGKQIQTILDQDENLQIYCEN